jgi:hypothetical protein
MSTSPGASDRVPGCGSLRNFLKVLAILLLKVPGDTTVRSDISLWEQLENRPALSDSPLLAEKSKSNVPNHSYNPAFPQATRERRASGATGYARDRCDPCRPVFVLGRESEKGMEVMGTG